MVQRVKIDAATGILSTVMVKQARSSPKMDRVASLSLLVLAAVLVISSSTSPAASAECSLHLPIWAVVPSAERMKLDAV